MKKLLIILITILTLTFAGVLGFYAYENFDTIKSWVKGEESTQVEDTPEPTLPDDETDDEETDDEVVDSLVSQLIEGTITEITAEDLAGVTSIRPYAFYNCKNLTSVELPDTLTDIGNNAFAGCSNLMSITIPANVTKINSSAFSNCTLLLEVYNYSDLIFEAGSTSNGGIASNALVVYNASDLVDGKPDSAITTIENIVYFANDDDFIAISSSNEASTIVLDGRTTELTEELFANNSNLTNINLSNCSNLKTIGDKVFYNCQNLSSITLPDSLITFGNNVFGVCLSLEYNTYENCNYLGTSTNPYFMLKDSETSTDSYTINSNCKFIYDNAFFNKGLTSIVIPNGVISIGADAFTGNNFSEIIIPDTVTNIGEYAFSGCVNLSSITIPNTVTSIGSGAFSSCSALNTVVIESSYVYNTVSRLNNSCGSLCAYATTVKVLKTIDDGSNTYLNNSSYFTKSEDGDYYVYTKV